MSRTPPAYVAGHDLLAGKSVIITAAAGVGIGFAAARRCVEEGATVMISDIHERRHRQHDGRLQGWKPDTSRPHGSLDCPGGSA